MADNFPTPDPDNIKIEHDVPDYPAVRPKHASTRSTSTRITPTGNPRSNCRSDSGEAERQGLVRVRVPKNGQ